LQYDISILIMFSSPNIFFLIFFDFFWIFLNFSGFGTGRTGWTGKVGRVGRVWFPGFPGRARVRTGWTGRVGTGLKRVGSSTGFFQIFLPASVLNPPVLTGHESDRFEHGLGQAGRGHGSRPRVRRVGSDPIGFF
jgi:hypothetical protein